MSAVPDVGPGGLRVPPVVADGSEAGHCFHLLFPPPSFFSFFFYVVCFSPTSRIFLEGIFFMKADFLVFFLLFTASIRLVGLKPRNSSVPK